MVLTSMIEIEYLILFHERQQDEGSLPQEVVLRLSLEGSEDFAR